MKSKAIFGLFAFAVVSLGMATFEHAHAAPQEKVTICHSRQPQPSNGQGSGAQGNAYGPQAIEVSVNSIIGNNGHEEHDGPIFNNTNQDYWGDIIPSFDYIDKNGDEQTYPGMNLAEGQAWLENNCQKPGTVAVDLCDPVTKPSGSISVWLIKNNFEARDCFEYEEQKECGLFDVRFTRDDTPYSNEFRYVIGSTMPALANWEGDGVLPVEFEEDSHGGKVDVTYYSVGPEEDYFIGFGIPNIWDGNGKTVEVSTNCEGGSGGAGENPDPNTPVNPEVPATPESPKAPESPIVLPFTSGVATPIVAVGALSFLGAVLAAGSAIKSRILA